MALVSGANSAKLTFDLTHRSLWSDKTDFPDNMKSEVEKMINQCSVVPLLHLTVVAQLDNYTDQVSVEMTIVSIFP